MPLCTAANDQIRPKIVSDEAGGAIVTWQDLRPGTNTDIYAQRVNASGVPQWAANGVALCTAANNQQGPTIASDGAGGAIVTWQDGRIGTITDIYVQRVAAGVPRWTADGVALCTAAGYQGQPTIVSDGAGGAIVTWNDGRSGSGNGNNDIYAQRVNAAGVPQWTTDGVALCIAANDQISPTIVSDSAGGAIVTWFDSRSNTNNTNTDIYAQRVSAAGVPQWAADGVALCIAANNQFNPTIASDGAGGAIVTWSDSRSGITHIYAQRVNAAGVPQWTANGVALCTAANNQGGPMIVSDGAGGAIVTWSDSRSAISRPDLYVQRVNAAGVPQWTADGVALCTAPNNQFSPTIASDGAGGAFVTWYDYRLSLMAEVSDIYAQHVNAVGVPQWTADGVPISWASFVQRFPTIVSNGAGGAIVTWEYQPHPLPDVSHDIYAQNVNADGTLGGIFLSVPPLSIPASFELHSIQPNPSVGDLQVSFSLLDGTSATLELYDLAGRRIESLSVGDLGPGPHVMSLPPRVPSLPPGVYCVGLTQEGHRAFRRVAIVR